MTWKNVKTDGFPLCDSETVYVGINSAGYCGCFNSMQFNNCLYETAEDCVSVMSDLLWWNHIMMPGEMVPDQIKTYISASPEMKRIIANNWGQMNRAVKETP